MTQSVDDLAETWSRHHGEWRDQAQVTSQWEEADQTDPALLRAVVTGGWWDVIERLGATVLVTREYEHLMLAYAVVDGQPRTSFMRMPHPSGLVADRASGTVHVASTRNPNQIYDLAPVTGQLDRADQPEVDVSGRMLVPVRSRFVPGCMYMHDLALMNGELYANAVGHNAVVRIDPQGAWERVWWPSCIEADGTPRFDRNYIQLNSIAPADDIASSYFSASSEAIGRLRPGHARYPVDGTGVVFSGATREVCGRGLTRPHSARLLDSDIWVDNSGYGTVGRIVDGMFEPWIALPGWTRGLCVVDDVLFVGTSRVIPRFSQYAPGLDVESSICALHAIDRASGDVIGRIEWPTGNQLFAIDWLPTTQSTGFAFDAPRRRTAAERQLFYSYTV